MERNKIRLGIIRIGALQDDPGREPDKRIAGSRNTKTGDITYGTNHNGTGACLSGPDHTS